MTDEEKPLEPGFSKCETCGEVKYLSGTPVCDSCRKKKETLGETGNQFCPMIREACKMEACMWWLSALGGGSEGEGVCAVFTIANEIEKVRNEGIDMTNHY